MCVYVNVCVCVCVCMCVREREKELVPLIRDAAGNYIITVFILGLNLLKLHFYNYFRLQLIFFYNYVYFKYEKIVF